MKFDVARIRWVFFDVGHTLIDESGPIDEECRAMCAALASHAIMTTPSRARAFLEQGYMEFAKRPKLRMMELLKVPPELREKVDHATRYRHELEAPYPGVSEMLERLTARFKLGVIANQSRGTRERLYGHGWGERISLCISPTEEQLWKPDPRIFQLALDRAKCRADEAVMVGDRIDNDIRPAKSIGMKTIRVVQGDSRFQAARDDAETPDLTVARIADVVDVLLP